MMNNKNQLDIDRVLVALTETESFTAMYGDETGYDSVEDGVNSDNPFIITASYILNGASQNRSSKDVFTGLTNELRRCERRKE